MRGILPVAILLITALPASAATHGLEESIRPAVQRTADAQAFPPDIPAHVPEQAALQLKMINTLQRSAANGTKARFRQLILSTTRPEAEHLELAETLLTVLRVTLTAIALVILALLTYTTVVRLHRQSREREKERFRKRWETPLYRRIVGDSSDLPDVAPSERLQLLTLLIESIAIISGDAASEVAAVARERGLTPFVLSLLSSRSRWKREIGIRGAGAIRLAEAVELLEHLVKNERRFTSLAAASALVKIDADRGFAALEPLLWRFDWSTERIAGLVRSANCPPTRLLSSLLGSAPHHRLSQVIRMIEFLGERSMVPELRSRIAKLDDPELAAAILHAMRTLGDAGDRNTVIGCLGHAHPLVRTQAAYALGGLGLPGDADVLMPLLRDSNWWVRYRAAQSLFALTGKAKTAATAAQESDPYARETLRRVLAEQG